ncbi:MAG: hypothetical protein LBC80_07910 [Treponema sp.]|jgi:pyruvate/oxaloacetate carboxyltransferase|nr:hypothetical protein [Treponema sp.]
MPKVELSKLFLRMQDILKNTEYNTSFNIDQLLEIAGSFREVYTKLKNTDENFTDTDITDTENNEQSDDTPALVSSEFDRYEEELENLLGIHTVSPEDVLVYVMFPEIALEFFKNRSSEDNKTDDEPEALQGQARYSVKVNGANYDVVVAPA